VNAPTGRYEMAIVADDAGLVAYLEEVRSGHQGAARTMAKKEDKVRQAGIAEGITKAIEAIRARKLPEETGRKLPYSPGSPITTQAGLAEAGVGNAGGHTP